MELLDIIAKHGLWAALAIYLIYRLQSKQDALEAFVRDTLIGLIDKCSAAIERNSDALETCKKHQQEQKEKEQ